MTRRQYINFGQVLTLKASIINLTQSLKVGSGHARFGNTKRDHVIASLSKRARPSAQKVRVIHSGDDLTAPVVLTLLMDDITL